ncbi:hypothetical protein BpHYR1_023136 [Brachionus plicatilis]|uniref:Uncharacterized protein n=1 Tax=Brachionus plicatilis TaxID=10195 RepID=A0A3M7QGA6_BRAPC|nr:hypothetical protein BpHYR1_023136 [Brachionus plicatilis]
MHPFICLNLLYTYAYRSNKVLLMFSLSKLIIIIMVTILEEENISVYRSNSLEHKFCSICQL